MQIDQRHKINIRDQNITVIGMSRSGMAAAYLAQQLGARIFVSDNTDNPATHSNLHKLQDSGINGEIGGHSDQIYATDLWVLSPGIAEDSTLVKSALDRDIPIVSEIEFASWFTDAPIIAVTGSNGKTTTVHALAEMCQSAFHSQKKFWPIWSIRTRPGSLSWKYQVSKWNSYFIFSPG